MGNEKLSEELLNTHPSEVLGKVHAWSGKIAALEARAEKAERERDEALALIKRLQNECDGWCKTHAERRDERDAALARVRALRAKVNTRSHLWGDELACGRRVCLRCRHIEGYTADAECSEHPLWGTK